MKTSPDQLTDATETQEATKESKNLTWLILVYRVPSEPTRLRGAVWRKLRNLGAVYMQNSAAAIPRTVSTERTMRALRKEIVESMSGKAFLINSSSVASDADLRAMFNEARNDEYDEILDKCKDFHTGIDKEIREEHYTY
ncbi:MAG: Chromate resistance protein ChrB, partial [Leifsonia sp.]